MRDIAVTKFFIIPIIVLLFAITWFLNKSTANLVAFYQLFFLFASLLPVLLFGFNKSLRFLQKFLTAQPLLKFGIFCIIVIFGYNLLSGFSKVLPTVSFGHTLSSGLIEFFIIEVPILGIFLLLYCVHAIANIKSENTIIFLFLFMLLFVLFGGSSWSASSIVYDQNIKSLAFFPHFYYSILFFVVLPVVIFIKSYDIKTIGFSFDIKSKDLFYFIIGSSIIVSIHCLIKLSVGALHFPNLSVGNWIFKIAYITFAIALPEELLMRGIGISVLEKRLKHRKDKTKLAIIITSILFGMAHYKMNIFGIVFSIFFGFIYAYQFIKTRKLIAPVLTHAFVDVLFAPYPF